MRLVDAPVLETARLTLRVPQASDFDAYAAFIASERSGFVGGRIGRDQAWRSFGHVIGHWLLRGYGCFVIVERDSGRVIGTTGPWFPEGWPEPEIAWSLWHGEDEGKGLAREAAVAAMQWTRDTLGWTTAISLIAPGNFASASLARRLGAVREGRFEQRGEMVDIWRHSDALPQ